MYNKTIMIGNLTRDIELKYLPSGSAVAKSSIASSYKYKSQTGEQKEEVCFQDGSSRSRHSLRVEEMKMLDTKSSSDDNRQANSYQQQGGGYKQPPVQYEENPNNQNHRPNSNQHARVEQTIPEIDIDDQIPF